MRGRPAAPRFDDQASGLRRIFEPVGGRWSIVLVPALRSPRQAEALAERARHMAASAGATLVIDAARAQLASAFGLALRYDLEHALIGDCTIDEACVAAGESLWVLPAARALDAALADERHARRVAAAFSSLAGDTRRGMLVLPAGRAAIIRRLPQAMRARSALIPVVHGADASAAVLTAVRQAVSDAEIDTFHLLFLGMGEAAAGRLLSGMAAIAQRHFGANLVAAQPVQESAGPSAQTDSGGRSVESVF